MIRRTGGNRTLVRPPESQSLILGLHGVFTTYSYHRRLSHCIAPEKQASLTMSIACLEQGR